MTITECTSCPNFRSGTIDGSSWGACAPVEQMVFLEGVSRSRHLRKLATACGDLKEHTSTAHGNAVAWPVLENTVRVTGTGSSQHTVSSCTGCVHFIDHMTVDTPGNFDYCAVQGGIVVLGESHVGCEFALPGFPSIASGRVDADGVLTDPELMQGIAGTITGFNVGASSGNTVAAQASVASGAIPDPLDYKTDIEVPDVLKDRILAWRAIEVGEGKKRVATFLPIFNPDYFLKKEVQRVDAEGRPVEGEYVFVERNADEAQLLLDSIPRPEDPEHPELYVDTLGLLETFTVTVFGNRRPLCMVGEPGTGKTEFARYAAYMMQVPFTRLAVTEDTLPDEFIGHTGFSEGRTHFVRGRLPNAISEPGVVLSDEFNTGVDAIMQMYRSLNDASRSIFLEGEEDPGRRVVRQHEDCFHLLAINPAWDARNLGTRELADADVSRLKFMQVAEPSEDVIRDIVIGRLAANDLTVTPEDLNRMMLVRKDIKQMIVQSAIPFSWSIRQDVKVAEELVYFSGVTAYKRVLGDYLTPIAAGALNEAVKSVFGDD